MNRSAWPAAAAAIAVALPGCSAAADSKRAQAGVQQFHALLDSGHSRAIYAASGDELKRVCFEQQFVSLLDAAHRKLGQTKAATRTGWAFKYGTAGKTITLNYQTDDAEGQASEQFVYCIEGDKPVLIGYHVNSNALILP